MDELFAKIDKEREGRYKQSWTKLDKGSKLNRLTQYVKREKDEKALTEAQVRKLASILTQLCETGALNKASEVEYEDEEIRSIKNLSFCEEDRTYAYKREEKKIKVSQRSKGHLERHFSKGKDSRKKER